MGNTIRHRLATLLGVIAVATTPAAVRAGAWTQATGGYYARLEAATRHADRVFAAGGGGAPYTIGGGPARYAVGGVRGYFEYGLSPGLTMVAGLEWKQARIRETAARYTTRGFGDLTLGARVALARTGDWPLAVQGEMTLPTGYDATDVPSLGPGQGEVSLVAQSGHGFPGGYATLELGGGRRPKDAAFFVSYAAEIGVDAPAGTRLRVGLRGRRAIEPRTETLVDPAVIERNRVSLTGGVGVPLGARLQLEATASGASLGANTLRGVEYALALAVWR